MIVQVALPVPLNRTFDYLAPDVDGALGRCVRVRFGPRRMVGVIVATPVTSEVDPNALVNIDGFADDLPDVPADILAMARFAADYYQHPLGITLQHAVPPRSRQRMSRSGAIASSFRLTTTGRAAVTRLPARAVRQQELANRLANEQTLADVDLKDRAPGLRALLKRWIKLGWVEMFVSPFESAGGAQKAGLLTLPTLNDEQEVAASALTSALDRFQPFLLQGVTGSGKTEVYLSAAAGALANGRQVLMLVPEINLTPQLAARVRRALPSSRIVELHSHLAAGQRLSAWRQAASGEAELILGTRLSIFAPLPRLGLIIVDEEHDTSYKQQDGLRYNARDLAVYRASVRQVPVVLGSATPSLESLRQVEAGKYLRLRLQKRAVAGALPTIRLVRQRDPSTIEGISGPLHSAIEARLSRSEQTLLFINRRGYSPSLLCAECGWMAQCERCSARLVVHRDDRSLRCHHCAHEEQIIASCPECGNQDLVPMGYGTQRLESNLRTSFPTARIARIDADSTRRKGAWKSVLDDILSRKLDILVGTQMMVKGHDFPHLTLVGVLGADNALYSADFRATERLFAQLIQVSGRAGRAEIPGEVIVQTDFAGHPLYQSLQRHDYDANAAMLLEERQALEWPPWSRLALLRAEAKGRDVLEQFLGDAHRSAVTLLLTLEAAPGVRISAPVPARLARRAGFERSQILAQASTSRGLQALLTPWREWLAAEAPRNVRWSIDVDPQEFD